MHFCFFDKSYLLEIKNFAIKKWSIQISSFRAVKVNPTKGVEIDTFKI